eukprot:m.10209 g.10209  ORF g.10209 m.10209 type:complete len:54 (+) comp5949_c0_seq1:4828-4989(+)
MHTSENRSVGFLSCMYLQSCVATVTGKRWSDFFFFSSFMSKTVASLLNCLIVN